MSVDTSHLPLRQTAPFLGDASGGSFSLGSHSLLAQTAYLTEAPGCDAQTFHQWVDHRNMCT
jgi:hypothetical protein